MKRAGAGPSANRITLLRDADGDGVAEIKRTFLQGLNSPFGMALVGDAFYVANTDARRALPLPDGENAHHRPARRSPTCPGGPINHHWTKNLIASPDGTKLYVTVGSNSNVGENGIDDREGPRGDPGRSIATTRQAPRLSPPACAIRTALAWEPQSAAVDRRQRARRTRQRPRRPTT